MKKILKSNWIHLVGFYMSILIFQIFTLISGRSSLSLVNLLFAPLMLLFLYGLIFLIGFYVLVLLLDYALIKGLKLEIKRAFFLEWFIFFIPIIVSAVYYNYYLWIVLGLSLGLTQLKRLKKLENES